MKVRDIIKLLQQDGRRLERTQGSHRQFKHATKAAVVTVRNDDLAPGTLNSIPKHAGLK
jgi:predicted RNA binding protein YcfA (HicA-like mRNA interferase family)